MLKRSNLRTIVAVSGATLVIAMASTMSLVVGARSQQHFEREIGRALSETAFQMADKLDADMASRSRQVSVVSKLSAVRDPVEAQKIVDELKIKDPSLAWVGTVSTDGIVTASSGRILIGANVSARPVFKEGIKGHFIGDVHEAVLLAKLLPNSTGEPMKFVDVATPIRDDGGKTLGVLATHFSWSWAKEVQERLLRPAQERLGLESYIVSSDGTVLLGPTNSIGQFLPINSLKLAQADGSGWAVETWPDGQKYLTGFARGAGQPDYAGLGWTILARQPIAAAFENADDASREILLWGVGFAALFSALAWFAASLITRPLHAIADAAVRLRRGEPGVEIPQLGGAAEVADLSTSLRALVGSLTKTQDALTRMEDAACHDTLTGLPNRRLFDQHMEEVLSRSPVPDFALLSLDLDNFKPVNDTLGHHAGDIVLRQVSARMLSCLRSNDLVARIGGDEFVIIVDEGRGKETPSLQDISERLIKAVNEPVLISGKAVRIGCSIGIANAMRPGESVQDMLDRADAALYKAKAQGRNCAVAA
ncbi:GGDEF domain-containing protein [Microvirga sp.]|uniref:GGDEF domain-containing protein n=1 Tax=Microvirga sp. TaxID=1873136 RepID=UPI0028A891DA|nr:GGDEF domain-containing protein [Microvirga sp.]